jgi:hypothetical protein
VQEQYPGWTIGLYLDPVISLPALCRSSNLAGPCVCTPGPSNLTASSVQEQYPGWTMRLYLDPSNLTASSVQEQNPGWTMRLYPWTQ